MKTLLCAIVKNENKYLEEWINHHKNLGFDKILLYDNNLLSGEKVITNDDFVQVINYRGKHITIPNNGTAHKLKFRGGIQEQAYNDCYFNHASEYDWIAYIDIDEYLFLDGNLKINEFLSQEKFKNVDAIQINWEIYGDNGNILYENKPINERFILPSKLQSPYVKTIVKTNNLNFISLRIHYADIENGKFVYPNGDETKMNSIQPSNFEGAKIKHFYTKSLEEWIDRKCGKTNADGKDILNDTKRRLIEFFCYNEITKDKLEFIKQRIGEDIYNKVMRQIKQINKNLIIK